MTDALIPVLFNGEWLIKTIHQMGLQAGYERVRIDRGQDPDTGAYYEVGYGPLHTVSVRTSSGERVEITREIWEGPHTLLHDVAALLVRNKEGASS